MSSIPEEKVRPLNKIPSIIALGGEGAKNKKVIITQKTLEMLPGKKSGPGVRRGSRSVFACDSELVKQAL